MLKKLATAIAAIGLLFTASCASLVTGGPLIREGEPTGVIQVANASNETITVVLISACSAASYGLNRMGNGQTIPGGQAMNFTVSAGCWDVSVGYATGRTSWVEGRGKFNVAPGRVARGVFR